MNVKATLIIITVLVLVFGLVFSAFPIKSDNIIQGGGAPIIQNIVNGTIGPRGYNGTDGIDGLNGIQGPQGPPGVVNGTSASFVNLYGSGLVSFNNITSPTFVNYILSKVSEGYELTASDIWGYATRTLTNLNDTRAGMIDNLDVLLSTRATQSSVDMIDGIVDSILVDTNELQVDWVNGGRLDLLIDAIKAKTDTIVANSATQSSVDVIDGIVDSILVGTNKLTSSYTPKISLTTTNPVQDTWYTVINEADSGQLYAVTVKNLYTSSKNFELRVTIDGTLLNSDVVALATATTYYYFIDEIGTIELLASSTPVAFNFPDTRILYYTSLKVEVRTTSATWATGFTATVRRFL